MPDIDWEIWNGHIAFRCKKKHCCYNNAAVLFSWKNYDTVKYSKLIARSTLLWKRITAGALSL